LRTKTPVASGWRAFQASDRSSRALWWPRSAPAMRHRNVLAIALANKLARIYRLTNERNINETTQSNEAAFPT
jgi:hypothetical protein